MRRVTITGIDIIYPLGNLWNSFFNPTAGKSAIKKMSKDSSVHLSMRFDTKVNFGAPRNMSKKTARTLDRVSCRSFGNMSKAIKRCKADALRLFRS